MSLIAVSNEKIIGHILFSPAVIESAGNKIKGMGLGPMAVLPELQGHGIGSQLVKVGVKKVRQAGGAFIIVLGHPGYYPRFGFERALIYGIKCEWAGVPDEAFLILWLDRSAIPRAGGLARYRKEFGEAI